jgi:GalNAc-alpha-(1->4)-GalNAc-alpha-(1->3)-diNAcBac-PP-undecaprenol alpha-1,4-N-acetyl-D-galactosaminyltransferase
MFVTNSLTGGGAERSINLVVNELFHRGWQVALIPINSSGPDLVIPKCEVFALNRQWRGTPQNTILAFWRFQRVVRSWNPDVIVLNCDLPEMFGAMLLSPRKLVVVEHSSIPWVQRVQFGKFVRKILGLKGATWIAVSSHLVIWPRGRKARAILQNPLQTIEYSESHNGPQRISRLVFIGRFSPEKHPEIALEIGAATGIEVVFIGSGTMRHSMEVAATARGIRSIFRGQVSNPWQEIQAGDLLIVPSSTEGDGLVVLEGLGQGIPMLVADIPDFRRFGFSDVNYCVDLSDFVSRIEKFVNSAEKLKIPFEFANDILHERELSTVGDSWEAFINQLD